MTLPPEPTVPHSRTELARYLRSLAKDLDADLPAEWVHRELRRATRAVGGLARAEAARPPLTEAELPY